MRSIFFILFLFSVFANAQSIDWGNDTIWGTLTLNHYNATTVPYLDGSKTLQSSLVTPTELGFVHGATSSLCGINQSCTFTNKIMSGSSNTFSNIAYSSLLLSGSIVNADISSSAAIARSKIAAGTASSVVTNDGSGNLSSTTVVGISNGGTNNGSLAVTAGGVLYTDGSKLVNVGAGTTGQALKSNGSSAPTWGAVAGGSGLKNYLSVYTASTSSGVPNTGNGDFELGATTGFALGTTGTLTNGLPTGTPTFGSGASSNLSINITNGGLQIAGTASLTYSQAVSATVAGNMLASNAFFIDKADQGGILTYSLKYFAATSPGSANWSGTSSSSFGVAVWDVTNSVWLGVSNPFGFVQSSGSGLLNGAFPVPTNTTQLRFVVYNANATSGTITVFFDDATVGPAVPSSINGRLVTSSAHVSSGSSTATTSPINYDTIDYDYTGSITTGAGTWGYKVPYTGVYCVAATGYFGTTTSGLDLYKTGVLQRTVGEAINNTALGGGMSCLPFLAGDIISIHPGTTATPTALGTIAQANHITIFMLGGNSGSSVPNPVSASYYLSANFSAGTTTPVNFDTKIYDYCNCVTTSATAWKFVAPISGLYQIGGFINPPASSNTNVFKNGSFFQTIMWNTGTFFSNGTIDVPLNANEFIDIRPGGTGTYVGGTPAATSGGSGPPSVITVKLVQSSVAGANVPTSNVFSSSFGFISAEFVSFGGTTEPSICSSSPCTMYRHTPAITSVTRTANGQYSINFASGTFSQPPVCTSQHTGFANSGWTQRVTGTVPTTTVYQVQTIVSSATNDGGPVDVICIGLR